MDEGKAIQGQIAGEAARSALVRKLGNLIELRQDQETFLEDIQSSRQTFRPAEDIFSRGEELNNTFIMRSGWAFRYRMLHDGRRQILSFVLPGDIVGIFSHFRRVSNHALAALSDVEVAVLDAGRIEALFTEHPKLASALTWASARDYAMLAEQVVRLGRQSAYERTAHLVLELWERLRMVDMTYDHNFAFPLTQEDVADALGLSTVHVNRTLKKLREDGLISAANRRIVLHDVHELKDIAEYDSDYLNNFGLL